MINYNLPTEITVGGKEYPINRKGDYRVILDVISALNDDGLSEQERAYCALAIFYNFNIPPDAQAAVDEMMLFINRNQKEEQDSGLPIMNWEQDFSMICDDINAKYGIDIRGLEYLHWWTMISYFFGIGEGQFSTIIGIRKKRRKGVKLDKWEQEFYNDNRAKVDLKVKFDQEEQNFMESILGK